MGSVFPDNVVSDGAETGPSAQLPNGLEELGVQWQGKAIVLLSLQGQAVHLPAAKFPAISQKYMLRMSTQNMKAACRRRNHIQMDNGKTNVHQESLNNCFLLLHFVKLVTYWDFEVDQYLVLYPQTIYNTIYSYNILQPLSLVLYRG